jgi:hypothetical protein
MTDLDPLLREAMARVASPVDARPSLTDVRRRARRHNRRRMAATASAVACTGVATAALIIRRDSTDPAAVGHSDSTNQTALPIGEYASTTVSGAFVGATSTFPTTTVEFAQATIDASLVWNALANLPNDPSATGLASPPTDVDRGQMPTAAMFGCETDACAAMFNYIVWHELARALGFFDIQPMQGYNPGIDFSQLPREGDVLQMPGFAAPPQTTVNGETTTTTTPSRFAGVTLIDGGAPEGAMEDAYQRLAGYNRTIVPSAGKAVEQTMVMPIGSNTSIATAVGGLLGVDGFDTWDPSLVSAPVEGLVAVVIGPDYWDRVQSATPTTSTPATSTSTTSTTIG